MASMFARHCAECSTAFETANARTVCCSPACGRVRGKRNSDLTRAANAAERNRCICEQCGATFQKTRNAPGRFCSYDCANASRRVYASPAEAKRAERQHWKERTGWKPVERAPAKAPPAKPARPCQECGVSFAPAYGDKRKLFCSAACSKRAARRVQGNCHRSRARRHGVAYEPVNPTAVFDRDGWSCKLCGTKTPRKLRGTIEPNAPELDHIVPISAGGDHSYRNTQCACRRCNGLKANKPLGQQRLFG